MQTLTASEWYLAAVTIAVLAGMGIAACLRALRNHPWTARLTADQPTSVNTGLVLIGLAWLGLFGLTVWAAYLGIWQSFHPDPANRASGQTPFGLGALLAALFGAPFVSWATVIKQTTLNFQKEGHITDRTAKAVEQLGAEKTVKVRAKDADGRDITIEESKPNIEVRIGGIMSLERIAQDSTRYDNGRDHVRVMEILCSYVRENAPAKNLTPTEPPFDPTVPRLDIQKALDVIKRRSPAQMSLETKIKYRLDLQAVDFDGADLSKGDFTGAIFWRCRFELAKLDGANFTGAQMAGSLLNYARWYDAKLIGTSLDHCILNRPKPTAGGFNDRSPIMAKINGRTVIVSDVSAMDDFGENPEAIFGSKDTTLCYNMDQLRKAAAGLFAKRQSAEFRNQPEKLAELDSELHSNPFKRWVPYDASDMATGHLRAKW